MNKYHELAEKVTAEIIAELKNGNVVWTKQWNSFGGARNYVTNRPYEGFNQLYLSYKAATSKTPYFITFKQAIDLGGYVRKGEKATPVIYWKINQKHTGRVVKDRAGNNKDEVKSLFYPFLHYVFNIDQVEGIDFVIPEPQGIQNDPIEICEKLIDEMPMKPEIRCNNGEAFYVPSLDYVNMPLLELFKSAPAYYSVLFHEIIHSTGHVTRLNRFKDGERPARFGDEAYSKEELVAEMGAAILCAHTGISNDALKTNSVAYIKGWIRALEEDKTLLITAANKAYKASSFVLGLHLDKSENDEDALREDLAA